MLAGMRSRFLVSFLLAFSVAACVPVQSQINGVPASVTSMGFGGNFINGVRPSVTSLGPNGYGNSSRPIFGACCANFFLPANPNPALFYGHRHHRNDRDKDKDKDRNFFAVGVGEPVYFPYVAPYADETDDDSSDVDYADRAGPLSSRSPGERAASRDSIDNAAMVDQAQKPVAAQPATLLVFKDGHRSEVFNYAVVGDTLFDFAPARTRKILLTDLDLPATRRVNDDRGVEFQIPAGQ